MISNNNLDLFEKLKIDKNHEIFSSETFTKDKYLFNILIKKINLAGANIMSDGVNYIISNESQETAPRIWTKDNFDKTKLKEIEDIIWKYYLVKNKMTFTWKKELYNALLNDNFKLIDKFDYFELGFMKCDELKETKPNDWVLDKVKPEESELIADYIYKFNDFQDDSVTKYSMKTEEEKRKECNEAMEKEIDNPNFYVLRNSDNKIVCMAHYTDYPDGTSRVWLVYTPDEERQKWYAAKLVYELTKKILNSWLTPILYTDQNYPNSNKAYANAGYKNNGTLVSFSCKKK